MKGKLAKGIDNRTHKDGTVSYRARVQINGKPEEIASAVAFLASGEASYITGAILTVDGGFLA